MSIPVNPLESSNVGVIPLRQATTSDEQVISKEQQSQKNEVPDLILQLASSDSQARFEAVQLLAEKEKSEITAPLIEVIKSGDLCAAPCAMSIAGELKITEAIPELVKYLTSENPNLKLYSTVALANMQCEESVENLISYLDDSNPGIGGVRASEYLSKIKSEKIQPLLINTINGENHEARCNAIWTLGELALNEVTINEETVDSLIKCLEDKHGAVRRLAAEALGKIKSLKAAEALGKIFRGDNDPEVSWYAGCALVNIRAVESLEEISKSFGEDNPTDTRLNAIELMMKLMYPQDKFQFLLSATRDNDPKIRAFAGQEINKLINEQRRSSK